MQKRKLPERERWKYINGVPVRSYKRPLKFRFMEAVTVSLIFIFIVWVFITR